MQDPHSTLVDRFQRRVDYVRLSVTDRCDFRCVYCMAEEMSFVPKPQVLTLEEHFQLAQAFTELGVSKIRLTGGEPLIRQDIMTLVNRLGQLPQLKQLVLTTNGSQLQRMAADLRASGVKRLNISLDSLRPRRFRQLTRHGNLDQVLAGIETAISVGFERIKINAVILKGRNEDEILDLVDFAYRREIDIAFIEEMPLGHIVEHNRLLSFCSSREIRDIISQRYRLHALDEPTGNEGPARYYVVPGSSTRLGFISPHSENFCHLCNRVRVTAEGRLLLCLGNEHSVDLRSVLRNPHFTMSSLKRAIVEAMAIKPERHHFYEAGEPDIVRFMNATGG